MAPREAGLDISGAVLMISGQPAAPARIRQIRATGAPWFTTYGLAETGRIAKVARIRASLTTCTC